jgi:hypothetical protein
VGCAPVQYALGDFRQRHLPSKITLVMHATCISPPRPTPPALEVQAEVGVPALRVRQLFEPRADGSVDIKGALRTLHRELMANLLELLGVLIEKPSAYARQVGPCMHACVCTRVCMPGWVGGWVGKWGQKPC